MPAPFAHESERHHRKITLRNSSAHTIQVFVTKYSNSDGSDDWFELQPNAVEQWHRKNWECLVVKDRGNRAGVYLSEGSTIRYQGQGEQNNDHLFQTFNLQNGVHFTNNSREYVEVFMSNFSGGCDEWFGVGPGQSDHWGRDGWDVLVVRRQNGDRFGRYVHSGSSIQYYGPV
ncbi:hypothetical protein HDV02_003946 [Globomyces sp. JEL0801]|nr:hypothetical protein HDV02_003946 [Globomyces sp. JEL0801]